MDGAGARKCTCSTPRSITDVLCNSYIVLYHEFHVYLRLVTTINGLSILLCTRGLLKIYWFTILSDWYNVNTIIPSLCRNSMNFRATHLRARVVSLWVSQGSVDMRTVPCEKYNTFPRCKSVSKIERSTFVYVRRGSGDQGTN